ncbi:hypothetical protein CVV65_12220 [Kyrpidia spormannii]|uniref:Acetolactate synthase n=1 Tax=Kyrpidia spormannii TaxID=2055160 RepID=A0A2K8N8D9_9BACL|nr:thiamine pyrophosphate-binding protein [Kyrpidia spormannii]ATY85598.1 hypothetical protein CVV65_12220 [Kyrpidia spormannii]
MRVADLWVEQWAAAGIEIAFGIPGVHNMALFDALKRDGRIRTVIARHELGAAYMADGYYRTTGKYALVLLITGPGLTNALTGIAEAEGGSSGMIVVSTLPRSRDVGQGRGALHELPDQSALVEGLVKFSLTVPRPEEAARMMQEVLDTRFVGRAAPLYIDIPYDLLDAEVSEISPPAGEAGETGVPRAGVSPEPDVPSETGSAGPDDLLFRDNRSGEPSFPWPVYFAGDGNPSPWLGLLEGKVRSWKRPAVVVGPEAAAVAPLCRELVSRWGVPALTTVAAKGVISGSDPWFAGTTWTPGVEKLLAGCDGLLAIGTRWSLRDWHREQRPGAETVLITPDPRAVRPDAALSAVVAGPLDAVLRSLLEDLPWEEAAARDGTQAHRAHLARTAAAAEAERVVPEFDLWLRAVRHALPIDALLAVDSCLVGIAMARYLPVLNPGGFLYPMQYCSLGFAVPVAIGAALGGAGQAVALTGDGSLMFTLPELATAVQEDVPLLVVVFNNRAYGSVRDNQRKAYGRTAYVELPGPNMEQLAGAFGFAYQKMAWQDLPANLWRAFPLRDRRLWEVDDSPVDTY